MTIVFNITAMTSKMKERERHFFTQRNKDTPATPKKGTKQAVSQSKVNGEASSNDKFMWTEEDDESQQDPKRWSRNYIEKRRKDRIKSGILQLGELLPDEYCARGQTTNEILDHAVKFVQEIRDKRDKVLLESGDKAQAEEIKRLRKELESVKSERDRFKQLLDNAGIPTCLDPTTNWAAYRKNPSTEALERMAATQLATLADRTMLQAQNEAADQLIVTKVSPKEKGSKKRPGLVSEQLKQREVAKRSETQKADEQDKHSLLDVETPVVSIIGSMDAADNLISEPIVSATNASSNMADTNIMPAPPLPGMPQYSMAGVWPTPGISNMGMPNMGGDGLLQIAPSGQLQQSESVTLSPSSSIVAGNQNIMVNPSPMISNNIAMTTTVPSSSNLPSSEVPSTMNITNTSALPAPMSMAQQGLPQCSPAVGGPMFPGQPIPVGTVQNQGLQGTLVLGPNGQLILLNDSTPASALMNMNMSNPAGGAVANSVGGMVSAGGQVAPPMMAADSNQMAGGQLVSNTGIVSSKPPEPTVLSDSNASSNMMLAGTQGMQLTPGMNQDGGLIGLPPVATEGLTMMASNQGAGMPTMQNSNMPVMVSQPAGANQPQITMAGMPNQPILNQQGIMGQAAPQMNLQPQQLMGAAGTVTNQVMIPGSNGMVPVNPGTGQSGNLPSALILPNGQIVPVVTQPQLLFQQATPVSGGLVVAPNNPGMPMINGMRPAMPVAPMPQNGIMQGVQNQPNINMSLPDVNAHQQMNTPVNAPTTTTMSSSTQPVSVLNQPISSAQISQTISNAAAAAGIINASGTQVSSQSDGPISSSIQSNTGQLPIMPITRGSEGQVPNMSSYPKTMTSQMPANTSVTVSQPTASASCASSGKKTSSAGGLPQVTQLPTTATAVLAPDGSIILTLAPSSTPVIDPRNVPVLPNVGQPMVAMEPAQNKKSSKSGKQRDIKPKRSSKSSKSSNAESSQRNIASPSMNASSAGNVSTVAAPLTVNTEVTSSSTGAPTDILAKAAESIFSSGMNDVSPPISSYYNPAHDDNPLQIDTSVTEAEEQGDVSPQKSSEKEVHELPQDGADPKNAVNQDTMEQDPVSLAFSAAVGEVTSESLTASVTSEVQVNPAPPISQIVSPPSVDTVTNVSNVDDMPPPLTAEPAPTPTKSSRKSKKKSKNKAGKTAPPPEPPPPEILPQVPVDDIDVKTMNSMEVDLNSSNTDDVEQILQEAEKLTRDIPIDNLPPTPAPPPPLIDHIEEALPTESPKGKTKKKKSKKDKSKNKEKKSSAKDAVLDTSAELEKITAIENAGQLTIAASNSDTMLPVTKSSVLSMPSGFELFGIQEPSVESQQNTVEKPTAQNGKKLETQSQQEVPEVTPPTGNTKSSRNKNRSNKRKNSNPVDMLPDMLSFSENQLPDVLDQLERYSGVIQQDSPKKSSKKSKHPGGDSSAEPPSKKKKKSSKAKEDKTVQDPLTSPSAVSIASLSPVSLASKISPLKDSDLTQDQPVVMQTPSPPKLTKSQPAVKLASPNKTDVITSLAEISSLNSNDMNSSGLGDPKRIGDADLTMEGVKDMPVIDESADQDSSLMDLIGENLNLLSEMATSQSAQDTEARDSVLDNISKSTADKENDKRQDKPAQELSAIHTTLPATPGRVRHENLPQLPSRLSHKTMASNATAPQSKAPSEISQNNAMQSSVNPEGSCNKNAPAAPTAGGQKQENLRRNSAEPNISSQNSRPLSHPPQPFNKTPESTPPALTHSQTFSKTPDSTPPALTHSVESLFSDSGEPITVPKNPAPTETSRQVPVVHSTGRAPPPASAAGHTSSQPPTSQGNRDQPLFHNSSKSQPVPSTTVNRTKESRPPSAQARNVSQPGQQQTPYTSPTFGMAAPRSGQSTTVANSNPTYTQPTTAPSFSFSLSSTTSTPTSASFSRQSGYPQFPFYPMPPISSQDMLSGKVREEPSSLSLSEMSNSMGQRSMVPPSHSASQRHEHQGAQAQGPTSHPHPPMGGFSMGSNSSVAQQREPQQCMQMGRPERETGRSSSAQGRLPGPSPTQPSGASASQGHSNQDISPFYQPNSYSSNSASLSLTSPPLHHHPPRPGGTSSSSSASSYQSSYSSVHQYNPTPFSAPSYDPPPLVFTQSTSGSSQTRTDSCAANQAAARKKATQERAESHRAKSVTSAKQHQSVEPQSHSTATQKSSRSSKSKKNSAKQYEMESMANPFDPSRSLTPYLPFSNMSPPPRNLANETPAYLPANLFAGHSRPLSNANPQQHKNTDINNPFNPLFPPGRTQNGLGFNFQPSFGMNPMHGNHGNSSQITPHSSSMSVPHMPNFNFSNIFNDMNSHPQNDSLNISPIKFPHGNPILPPQAGMDHNSLQHHHQGSSLYHNRPHLPPHQPVIHNAMTINSILGHNPHGFDARPMGPGINSAPFPAHGHAASFGMPPPLNFSMHDH